MESINGLMKEEVILKEPTFTFVVPTLNGGGAERVVSVLASAVADLGYNSNVIVHYKTEGEYPLSKKVNVYYDAKRKDAKNNLFGKIKKLFRIRKKIIDMNTTYLIPFMDSCLIHSFYASFGLKIKLIATIRISPRCRTSGLGGKCDKIVAKAQALYAQTMDEKEYYSPEIQKKTFILPNPVNAEAINLHHQYQSSLKTLVLAGRFTDQKNYPMIVNCAQILKQKGYSLQYKIFGDGPKQKEILQVIHEAALDETVYLMGRSSKLIEEFNQSDIYIMTSNFEGMPNTLMEAMAVGLPCISTDCPSGPSDLIQNGKNGILVPVNDAEKLAAEIEKIVQNPDYAKHLGQNAKETIISDYTPEIIAKRFVEECMKC